MNIDYQYAVLSFCQDLTDPNAGSVPIGLLAIGRNGDTGFLLSVTQAEPDLAVENIGADPITQSLLHNFQSFIKRQIDEGLKQVPANEVFNWLQDKLRNTIHVSVLKSEVLEVEQEELLPALSREFLHVFQREVLVPRGETLSMSMEPWLQPDPMIGTELPDFRISPLPRHQSIGRELQYA